MMSFSQQAATVRQVLDALIDLHRHVNDAIAGCDATEAERELRHMLRILEARAEMES